MISLKKSVFIFCALVLSTSLFGAEENPDPEALQKMLLIRQNADRTSPSEKQDEAKPMSSKEAEEIKARSEEFARALCCESRTGSVPVETFSDDDGPETLSPQKNQPLINYAAKYRIRPLDDWESQAYTAASFAAGMLAHQLARKHDDKQ